MDYYNSVYYSESNYGEYNFNSYAINYDYDQVPQFVTYNNNEYNQSNYVYDPSFNFSPSLSESDYSYQTIAYSTTTFNEPKSLVYEPNYGMTQLVLSYNTLEFNEPAYDEYDPTPYGGGYDIDVTYGKPLPPSDKICYPPFGSNSIPIPAVLPSVEKDAIDEKEIKPQKVTEVLTIEDKPQSQENSISNTNLKPYESEESESESEREESDNENDYGSGIGSVYNGEHFDGYEKQVATQCPSGYGLETLDLCESLFGNWPCLSRMKRRENCCEEVFNRGNNWQQNMWKGTADYLFGNPYPYGGNGSSYGGEVVYGYERHYPIQAQYKQIDYTYE